MILSVFVFIQVEYADGRSSTLSFDERLGPVHQTILVASPGSFLRVVEKKVSVTMVLGNLSRVVREVPISHRMTLRELAVEATNMAGLSEPYRAHYIRRGVEVDVDLDTLCRELHGRDIFVT